MDPLISLWIYQLLVGGLFGWFLSDILSGRLGIGALITLIIFSILTVTFLFIPLESSLKENQKLKQQIENLQIETNDKN